MTDRPFNTRAGAVMTALALLVFCVAPADLMARRRSRPKPIKSHRDPPPPPNKVDGLMQAYDKDFDGQLDTQEMKVFQSADAADAAAALAFDLDHNGVLSTEEISAWRNSAAASPH